MTSGLNLNFDRENSDEYRFVEQTIRKTINENAAMNEVLDKQKDIIRYSFLNRLLKGGAEYDLVAEQLENFNITFSSDNFAVMLIYIENLANMFYEEKMTDRERYALAKFIITNIIGELVNNDNPGFVTEIDNMRAVIVNVKDENREIINKQLSDALEYGQNVISANFDFTFVTAISGIHKSAAGIADAYREVLSAVEYGMFYKTGDIIFYDNIKARGDSVTYSYSLEQERLLVNYISAGDENAALGLLDDIISINFSGGSLSLALSKCLMFDLIGTVVKTLNEIFRGDEKTLIDEAVSELTSVEGIYDMKPVMERILKKCCNFVKSQNIGNIPKKIINIIGQCYADPNLNVAMLGYRLKMHPTYISAVFKEQIGDKLLD
jgi:YesN/AraC family two-component response regulator